MSKIKKIVLVSSILMLATGEVPAKAVGIWDSILALIITSWTCTAVMQAADSIAQSKSGETSKNGDLVTLKAGVESLRRWVASVQDMISSLKGELKDCRIKVDDLKEEFAVYREEITNMQQEIDLLECEKHLPIVVPGR